VATGFHPPLHQTVEIGAGAFARRLLLQSIELVAGAHRDGGGILSSRADQAPGRIREGRRRIELEPGVAGAQPILSVVALTFVTVKVGPGPPAGAVGSSCGFGCVNTVKKLISLSGRPVFGLI